MYTAEQLRELFEQQLPQWLPAGQPATLYEPIRQAMTAGGKRTRPVLLLLTADLFGLPPQHVMAQAVALEVFHTFTLIHDDIMDQSDLRRGQITIHRRFGEPTAILAGDAMLAFCFRLMSQGAGKLQEQLICRFTDCALRVCEGQQMDMDFEQATSVSVADYLKMIERKTAELLGFSAFAGALLAGAAENDCAAAFGYGKNLGIAFQLKDDYLDMFGNSEVTGKPSGGDVSRNKKTFLIAKTAEIADANSRQQLLRLLTESNGSASGLEEIKTLIRSVGVDQLLLEELEKYSTAAIKELERISVAAQRKSELQDLTVRLMRRRA